MANDSPGEALAVTVIPVEAQGVAHVGDQGNSGAASGGRDDEDLDNAVNRDSGAEREIPGDLALNVPSTGGDQNLPQKDSAEGGDEGTKDAILGGTEDEMERTTARMANISTEPAESSEEKMTSPNPQQNISEKQVEKLQVGDIKSLGSLEAQNSGEGVALPGPDTKMEDAPDIVHNENRSLAPSEDIAHAGTPHPHSGRSATFEEPQQQSHNNITHETGSSNDQRGNASVDISNGFSVPLIEGQLQYPSVQIPSANPVYESSHIVTTSTAPLIQTHGNDIEPNPLVPFPVRMNTPPPPLSEMTNAILALTYPFPPMEPVLPQQQEGRRIDAYVKLCFDDGNVYYIKNAAVIFGRAESSSQDRAINRNRNQRGSRGPKEVRGHQRTSSQPKTAKSTASSASFNGPRTPNNSRRTSIAMTTHTGLISSYNESARPFFTDPFTGPKPQGYPQGLSRLDEEALIHLPPTGEPSRKNISRRHARLSFNAEKEVFELQVMGKNGAFVENEWVECGSTLLLHKEGGHVARSGEKAWRIQIGGVGFALVFPPRDPLENEESGVAAVGKEGEEGMSLAFLDGSGREITTDINEEEEEDEDAEEKEELVEEGEEGEEEEEEEGDEEEEEIDSELEAEENAYAMAPSAEDLSDDDSMDGYEEDDEGLPPPVRGKSFINGYPAAFVGIDGEEDEEEGEEDEEADDEEDQPQNLHDVEGDDGEDDDEDDDLSSSSGGDDDGDDYVSGPARKRKKPLPQAQKPIARKNIKMLEALKRPKSSPEPDPKRSKGRPKKTVASKGVSKKPMKGVSKKQLTPQQQERERKKQEKARRAQEMKEREFRDRQERLRQLREEERREQEQKRKELEKREAKAQKSAKKQAREELIRERELKKEKQLRDVLKNKELQKSLNEAEKAEKARLEAERHEKRLLERQEKLMREARDKEAAAQAKRRAQEAATDSARKSAKIQLPSTFPGETPKTGTSSNLPPLQLPTISAAPSMVPDASVKSPSRLPPDGHHTTEQLSVPSGYNEYNHFPIDPSLDQFDHPTFQNASSLPPSHHPSIPNQFATVKEPRQPKPPKEPKQKKEKPPPKRKRSPSPPINEADFPPEALLKPNASYLILIHEAISNSEKQMLSLPDIYRAIQRKYPYFKLRVTTTGWQSSVRHNLSQSAAFERVQREGKGWLWKITEGFNIEKEKKKKLLPPPPLSQIIHPHHGHYAQMVPGPNGMGTMPMIAYGVMPNQQGVPLPNGMYMGVRPPGIPGTAPAYPNQPQMVLGGVVQAQYPIQPNQYPQPLQQTITPIPSTQPTPPSNTPGTTPVYAQGIPPAAGSVPVGATTAAAPRSTILRAPIPPPPLSNATRIQMAQLASQRPPEQRLNQMPAPPSSQPPPPLTPLPPSSATPPAKSVHIDDATLIAFRDVIDNAEKQMKAGGLNSMPGTNFNQLRTLITIALDPTSPESAKSRQLLGGALQLVQQNQKAQKDQQGKISQGPMVPGKAHISTLVAAQPAGAVQRPVEAQNTTGVSQVLGPQQVVGAQHAVRPQQTAGLQQAMVPQNPTPSGAPTAFVVQTSPQIMNAPIARAPAPTPAPIAAPAPALSVTQKSPTPVTTVPLSNTPIAPSRQSQSLPEPQSPSKAHPQPQQPPSQPPSQPPPQPLQQTPPPPQPQMQAQSQPSSQLSPQTPSQPPQLQSQSQAEPKPTPTGPPKATSQQIMNLLARLKKQKQAQQQAPGQNTSPVAAAVSSPSPSSAPVQLSPAPQPPAQQLPVQQPPVQQIPPKQSSPPHTPQPPAQQGLKRSIEHISTVASPETGVGAVVAEGHTAKKVDDGEGKQVKINLEAPVDSQPQNNEETI